MSAQWGELYLYFLLLVAGFLPHEAWRWLGFLLARGLDERSEALVWVRAVATSVLAGVIARLTLLPAGALADVPASLRVGAVIVGFAAFLLLKRSVLAGVVAGELALILAIALRPSLGL